MLSGCVLAAGASAAAFTVVFRGDASMDGRHAAVFFQIAHRDVVNFQLNRIDVLQMSIRRNGSFSGCNEREAGTPCVHGRLNRARDHATGTVRVGASARWKWSAVAIGTQG